LTLVVDKANQKFRPIGRLRSKPTNPTSDVESIPPSTPLPDATFQPPHPPPADPEPPAQDPKEPDGLQAAPLPASVPVNIQPLRISKPTPITVRRHTPVDSRSQMLQAPIPNIIEIHDLPEAAAPLEGPVPPPLPEEESQDAVPTKRSRKTQTPNPTNTSDEAADEHLPAKRARRSRSAAALDTNVESGDPIDPTSTSMKDLCASGGPGRVSSRFLELQVAHAEAKRLEKERRARIAAIREAKDKRGVDIEDPTAANATPVLPDTEAGNPLAEDAETTEDQDPADAFDYKRDLRSDHFSVSMRIDASGNLVVDEDSLVVDRAANPEYLAEMEGMAHVEESDASHFVNSASHSRKTKGSRWTRDETDAFFEVLLYLSGQQQY
jgi:hypothetical protein